MADQAIISRQFRSAIQALCLSAYSSAAAKEPPNTLPAPEVITIHATEPPTSQAPLAGSLVFASYLDGESEIYQIDNLNLPPLRLTDGSQLRQPKDRLSYG